MISTVPMPFQVSGRVRLPSHFLASHPLSYFTSPLSFLTFATKSVFTKCKESLQDGPRLEYISWRLWHRQLEARRSGRTNKPFSIPPRSPHLIPAFCPLTPVSELGVEHPGKFSPSPSFLSSSASPFLTWHTCFVYPTSRVVPRIPRIP